MNEIVIYSLAIIGAITVLRLVLKLTGFISVFGLFITSNFAGAPISLLSLILMKFRKVDVNKIITCHILLFKNGLKVEISDLELSFLEGRNLDNISRGLVYAKQKGLSMTLNQAKEADLKGIDIIRELDKKST